MEQGQHLNVVTLPTANLADIPAMLRRLATQIETGDWGEVEAAFMILPRTNDFPKLFGWGKIEGINEPIIQLEMAKHWLVANLAAR